MFIAVLQSGKPGRFAMTKGCVPRRLTVPFSGAEHGGVIGANITVPRCY